MNQDWLIFFIVMSLAAVYPGLENCERKKGEAKVPSIGEKCDEKCQKPYVCSVKENSNDGKECMCKEPYILEDGNCYLKCKEDEYYVDLDFECKKRCGLDEIQDKNGTCRKVASIGQECQDRTQCRVPYCDCINGTCECMLGFVAQEGTCISETYDCPYGEVLRGERGAVLCGYLDPVSNRTEQLKNAGDKSFKKCPSDYSCVWTDRGSDRGQGYCCPAIKEKCLVGQPHPNAKCTHNYTDGSHTCPTKTHYCRESRFGYSEPYICCPEPCPDNQMFMHGRCYARKNLGDECELEEQCKETPGARCLEGRCRCKKGFLLKYDPTSYGFLVGMHGNLKCELQCGDDEFPGYPQCHKFKKLGEACDPDDRLKSRCGDNAFCSKLTKKCRCDCGKRALDEYNCDRRPCVEDSLHSDGDAEDDEDKAYAYLAGNYTFCRTPATKSSRPSFVPTCPTGHYCAEYSWSYFALKNSVGVCCPKSEKALCPDGTFGKNKCDPAVEKSCGGSMKCHKYLKNMAVRSDPTEGHVCC